MAEITERRVVVVTLTENQLGTVPKSKEVYANYIATKAPAPANGEEEVETVEEAEERGWSTFHKDDIGLLVYDYMIKGFLKDALETLMENGTVTPKIKAYKKWIDRLVFVYPRRIHFMRDEHALKEPDGCEERPLRAMGPKGERVTLVRSDYVIPGTSLKFEIELLKNTKGLTWEVIEQCLEFGRRIGLGQWRSGGWGRFDFIMRDVADLPAKKTSKAKA